jgi:hypothetical protein
MTGRRSVPDKDHRYTLEGQTIEAFQMTEATRYQQKHWPEWMDSRYLVTYEGGEQRLNINDVETKIPKFGWVVKYPDGSITAVGYEVMEGADKVVKEVVVKTPRADAGISDEALAAAHGIELPDGHEGEDTSAQPVVEVTGHIRNIDIVDSPQADDDLLEEVSEVYALLFAGSTEAGTAALKESLTKRVDWCICIPGACRDAKRIGCRQNSPLAK